ncbi:hypothetical protein EB821_01895 [Candidatus Marinimicrobia bacterium PRS2]|nr:hypothetical protein EB821_01895 [Candidatus Marinimicrobia bacterium PRS2]
MRSEEIATSSYLEKQIINKTISWKNFWIITGYISSVVSALLFLFADFLFSDYLSNSEIVYYRILFFVNSLLAVSSIWSLQKINYWILKLVLTTLILFSSRIVYVTMIDNTPVENANVAEKYAIDLLATRAEKKQKDMIMNLEDKVSELEKEREVKDSLNSVAVDSILREKELLADSLNYALSDIKLKFSRDISQISREKQLLADSLRQYQVDFAHSLNKAKQAYIDSTQQTLASNVLIAIPAFKETNVNKQEKRDSQAIDKHYNEGKRQFENKNYNLALKSFNQTLNISYGHVLSHYYRGWANYYMGFYNDALVDAEYCVKNRDNSAYSLKGWAKYKLGNHKEAFSDFNECIRLNKTDSKCYNGKGNYYFNIKINYKLALDAFSNAIRYNSKEGKYYFNRGLANERLRYKGDACADYRKAVRLGFTQAQSQLNAYCK